MSGGAGLFGMILVHLPLTAGALLAAGLAWAGMAYFRRPAARVRFVVEVVGGEFSGEGNTTGRDDLLRKAEKASQKPEKPGAIPALEDHRQIDVCVVGSAGPLGFWDHPGLVLKREGQGRWAGVVSCSPGESFEYKITRGGWEREACRPDGSRGENFRLEPSGDLEVVHRVSSWTDTAAPPDGGHTLTGDFRFFPAVKSKVLGGSRPVIVYLPPGYTEATDRYPVLYFHDGNNAFDKATAFGGNEWHVDEVAEGLIKAGVIRPFIGVGVYNTFGRENEYTPFPDPMTRSGGEAAGYARFLKEELKPFIDREFRTLPGPGDTGTVGSSLGGLVSLYLGVCHGETFGLIGGVSPSLWWGRGAFENLVEKAEKKSLARRIWLCMGDHEGMGRVRVKPSSQDGAAKAKAPDSGHDKPLSGETAEKLSGGSRLMRGRVGFPDRHWVQRPEPGYPGIERNRRLAAKLAGKGFEIGENLMICEVLGGRHSEIDWARRIHLILMFLLGKNGFDPRSAPVVEEWQAYYGDDRSGPGGAKWFEARRVPFWKTLFWGRGTN